MKECIISIALVFVIAAGLTTCGQETPENKSPSEPKAKTETASDASERTKTDTGIDLPEVKLVFSTRSSGDVNYIKAIRMITGEISEKTNDKFTMETHENGSLMTQEGEVDAIAGENFGMMLSSPFLIFDQLPYLAVFAATYIFQDERHVRAVMDGEIGQKVADDVAEKSNVRQLSILCCEARHLDVRDVGGEIAKPENLDDVNLRMSSSSVRPFMGKALGADPTPMAYTEIYQGLQTGAIDGQENPLPTATVQKWYEVTSQIALTGRMIEPVCIATNGQRQQALPQEYRDIMTEAVKIATAWRDETNLKQEQEAITSLKEQGLTVIEPDLDAFVEYSENYYLNNKDMVRDWDMGLYHQIKGLKYQ